VTADRRATVVGGLPLTADVMTYETSSGDLHRFHPMTLKHWHTADRRKRPATY